jgi:hypothetical protein
LKGIKHGKESGEENKERGERRINRVKSTEYRERWIMNVF